MNGIQNHKAENLERPYPGCLGRVVSLFDLSAGMPGNKLLMDKPHRDGKFLFMFQNHSLFSYYPDVNDIRS